MTLYEATRLAQYTLEAARAIAARDQLWHAQHYAR